MTALNLRRYHCCDCGAARLGRTDRLPEGMHHAGKGADGDRYRCSTCKSDRAERERGYALEERLPDMAEMGVVKRLGARRAPRRGGR